MAIAWTGICLGFGGWLALRAGARDGALKSCSLCGRAEKIAGPLARGQGVSICGDCLRSSVGQLKRPEPLAIPPSPQPDSRAAEPEQEPAERFTPEADVSPNGSNAAAEKVLTEPDPAERRFEL